MSEKSTNPFAQPETTPAKLKKTKSSSDGKAPKSPFGDQPTTEKVAPVFADYGSPAKQGPKKSYKKLIIGVSAGVGALVVVIVAVVVFIAMTSVSKTDYRTAYERLSDIQRESNSTDLSYTGFDSDTTASDVDKYRDKAKQAMQKVDGELNDLSKLKAIKNDKEAKLRYDKLDKALDETTKALDNSMNAVKDILPLITAKSTVSDVDYDTSDAKSYYKALADSYNSLAETAKKTKASDEDLQGNLKDLATASTDMANYYQDKADDKDVSYSTYTKASNKFTKASRNISDALTDLTKDLSDKGKALGDAANSLQRYLYDRYTGNDKK